MCSILKGAERSPSRPAPTFDRMPWDLRPVDPGFFDDARYRFTATEILSRPAVDLFAAIAEDPAGWGRWFPGFSSTGRYLTPPPHGTGSRRTVRMASVVFEETVIAWEPGTRYSFRVERAGAPIAYALAEDYTMVDHGTYSSVQWTFAADPRPPLGRLLPRSDPLLAALFRRAMERLDRIDRQP